MVKQKIVIDDTMHLYEHTFNEFIDKYQPLRDAEEKRYIKVYKYPIIFGILPTIMKRNYSELSRASVQIYATRLGLSRISHNEKIKELVDNYENSMFNTNKENMGIADLLRHKITYNYQTQASNDGCIYLSTTEDVKSYISEYGDSIGLSEYQFALAMFFVGIQDATLQEHHKSLINDEINLFWKIIELRKKKLCGTL